VPPRTLVFQPEEIHLLVSRSAVWSAGRQLRHSSCVLLSMVFTSVLTNLTGIIPQNCSLVVHILK